MASRGKVLVQMCLDSSETIASNIYNEEPCCSKSFVQRVSTLSAASNIDEGSLCSSATQDCLSTISNALIDEHLRQENVPTQYENDGSDFSAGSSDNYIPSDNGGQSNIESSSDSDTPLSKRMCRWKKADPPHWKKILIKRRENRVCHTNPKE
ncbi:uncharacterized protein LOC115878865 [Sitophilus oryzae]|uniref:Uncharacterized protein LOC115878865 n=1 Tax=Sitophilus oryzae TaxID=7048 RepID=A0A6J2XKA5_SITOR|nr:uncharacterized protein LOC115878865 [Sitophilus oryzae]